MQDERLAAHLKDRPAQLAGAKEQGVKIVGYFPGSYVPEEMILAAGAVPLCLVEGGDTTPLEAASSVIPSLFCPFSRAQIGERLLKRNPYYSMVDMLVSPVTCQHLKKVTEIWEYNGDIEIFKLAVPHQHRETYELDYFTDRLKVLKARLESLTGNKITDEKLDKSITLYNRMRELLKQISLLRRSSSLPLNATDFIKLNHASFYADPVVMVDILEAIYREASGKETAEGTDAPRLLLIGPNIGYGDYKIMDMIGEAGGEIVIEEIFEGVRYYWHSVGNDGDHIAALAKTYLIDRVPGAFMRYSTQTRYDFISKLIEDFNVSGVIWYELLGCETYDIESYFFARKMEERNIPMLILESDYSMADIGQIKVRLDAFIEMFKGGSE